MRSDRLVATLLILQARGKVTARELAEELEVSEKTARRDLDALLVAGLPLYSTAGRGGGWQLLGGGTTDLSGLNAAEARALFTIAATAVDNPSPSEATANALRKLRHALPQALRDEAELAQRTVLVDRAAWGQDGPTPPPDHLDAIQRAIIERRRVRIAYVDRARTATERIVDPLGLVSKGSVWYLIGATDKGLRTFRIARIDQLTMTDQRFERPSDFDLTDAWRSVTAVVDARRLSVRATVEVDSSYVPWLRSQFGTDLVVAELDATGDSGRSTVVIGGPSTHVIAQHLAGWGNLVTVVEPEEVRQHLARLGRELAELYGADQ